MNTAEILRAAAQRVRQGWCQERLTDYGRGVCAQGAVMEVMFGSPCHITGPTKDDPDLRQDFLAVCRVFEPVHRVIGAKQTGTLTGAVRDWNNAKGQTAENVAAGLEMAAIIWEQQNQIATNGCEEPPVSGVCAVHAPFVQ